MATSSKEQRAIPDYVDEAALSIPNDIWATVPKSSTSLDEGWNHWTYTDLARAVNNMAWWIEKNVGVAQRPGQTIGYMGANDLRYVVILAAALMTGYIPLFTSPRNSLDGQKSLLRKTGCEIFLTTIEMQTQLKTIQEALPEIKVYTGPTFQELFGRDEDVVKYKGRYSRDVNAHSLIIHTSGSTGLPKPIYLTVGGLNSLPQQATLAPEGGFQQVLGIINLDRRPMIAAVPFFHAMGLLSGMRSVMCHGTIVTLPSGKPLSAGLIIDVIAATNPTNGMFPPSILEDIAATEQGISALGKLERVFYAGAPLANASGDKICKVTHLSTAIGSTEGLLFPTLLPTERSDWAYFHWASASGAVMEPTEDGTYELVLKPKDTRYQAVFHTFPELHEWRTKDLFKQHDTKPYLWKYSGRRDDIIVLSNGEKFNPVLTEKLIESHPWVKGALVVGQGRFQAGLLIEPEWDKFGTNDPSALIDQIWSIVEEANREAPAHARIYRTKIAVTKRGKFFARAGKGSVIRLQTASLFNDEIDALYADEGYSSDPNPHTPTDNTDLTSKIHAIFTKALPLFTQDTSPDTDIFTLSVDSLDILALTNVLKKALPGVEITSPVIYSNPSVRQLAATLSSSYSQITQQAAPPSREEKLDAMVRKYTSTMRRQPRKTAVQRPEKQVVALTGSTGSLGSHVLETLLLNPSISRVYCLNRSDNAEARQKSSFAEFHDPRVSFDKAVFLTTNFADPKFGLSEEVYNALLDEVTVFIHSAWSVDFNLSLESYENTHIAGTFHAAAFASRAKYNPPVVFISSIASVGAWSSLSESNTDDTAVPETVSSLFDTALPLPQGYGESKHVAARILAIASDRLGIRTAIVRAGQLAGTTTAYGLRGKEWNKHEWLPTLIHTSKILGMVPKTLGEADRVDWVPMDVAGETVADIALAVSGPGADAVFDPDTGKTEVFHLVNPKTTSWSELYPVLQEYYNDPTSSSSATLKAVDYSTWISALSALPRTKEEAERVPGLKLLEFYESMQPGSAVGLPALQTRRSESVSAVLRGAGAVGVGEVGKWVGEWSF
ncbi:acetyl-CoA synthetase-like protein [Plenodomus tracheiphilus IPT5]|uniref:Acetyl-CoA synthetase-like protein n=1 Tax=Plenodomus tracheiphilus IPT5 TaxID=1408161 RepID=A0A6A7B0G6_9PLEO|nr:acetyl-CoA synthetase-like protein [Plenodomus tracheiphilus IPT5]